MPIEVTNYMRPHGRTETVTMTNVLDDDAEFFQRNRITVSMEDIGIDFAVYADTGRRDEDDEPIEHIVFAQGRSCEDTMKALRELIEKEEGMK